MPKILALDTSSDNCSATLWSGAYIHNICEKAPRSHTQLVLPMVQECLKEGSIKAKDLDVVAFGCGPGSFTGIRIATGIAQGLAYGSDCRIFAISNIEALALQSFLNSQIPNVLVAIDARMDEVYWAFCRVSVLEAEPGTPLYKVQVLGEEQVTKPESVQLPDEFANESVVGVGSGFDYVERFPAGLAERLESVDTDIRPEAKPICELARLALHEGKSGLIDDALPSYVRNTVTWKKLPGRE